MKDRIPGAPGQYKAVVTEEELLKMQAGEAFVITMTRDDQPIEEGTPYNKAAVLPDVLAQQLCPDIEDPTPADAFDALASRMKESTEYPGCYYRTVDGEEEWLNPPMNTGVEYRTTDRYNSEPVYTRILECGQLSTDGVVIDLSPFNIKQPLTAFIHNSSGAEITHHPSVTGIIFADMELYMSAADIVSMQVYAILRYTKE